MLHGASPEELFKAVRNLSEIGHLGTDADPRRSVHLGIATATINTDGEVEFSGHDQSQKKWSAWLPVSGGVGWTTVWTADFDHNGKADLMIASYFPGNGRCIDGVTISFLMFDDHGRPNPWIIYNQAPRSRTDHPSIPGLLIDRNRSVQLLVINCEYSERGRQGRDLSVAGVYEAHDSMWKLVRPELREFLRITHLVASRYGVRASVDKIKTPGINHWPDLGNDRASGAAPSGQILKLLPADPACSGVRLGPLMNGEITLPDENGPCKERSYNRMSLSGETTCYGWPSVVLDREMGGKLWHHHREDFILLWAR